MLRSNLSRIVALAAIVFCAAQARAEDEKKDLGIELAEGKLVLTAPETWKREEPRSQIIEHEFSIPAAEGDELPGRMTIMAAGGSVEDNIDRWYAQFKQPDGGSTKEASTAEKKEINGLEVHFVDIPGTFIDRPRPAAEGVEREGYRMLGVIIVGDKVGKQFIKFYGPAKTVEENAEAFTKMIEGLEVK